MFVLSIAGVLVACILMAFYRDMQERERATERVERIKRYTDGGK